MEPRIQYAKTSDGVNIAFCVMGEGDPFVEMPGLPFSVSQLEWQTPETLRWQERLASGRKLVRYDCRGFGLSEREVEDFSLPAMIRDLQAVVEQLELQRFVIFAPINAGPAAIAYTTLHPTNVSHLILWNAHAHGWEFWQSAEAQAFIQLREKSWELYTETTAHNIFGWSSGDASHRLAEFIRQSVNPKTLRSFFAATLKYDVGELLPKVGSPTLVMARREGHIPSVDRAKRLASRIPGAHLVVVDGAGAMPYTGEMEPVVRAIKEFLGVGGEDIYEKVAAPPQAMTAILFADIADSTALTERLGDAAFRDKARELDGALRAAIRERGGTPVEGKLLGDGVLAVFTSAREAIEAALACGAAGRHAGLPLHLGIHAGDVIRERDPDGRDNVYGGAVNIASRIAGLSAAGEVLVSETVRSLARTSAGVRFEDRGEQALKGVGEAVRVWAVVEAANQQTDKPANQGGT
jgi:class 3 adenylate cyclase/pimeloyl-ACP methyl ester carboxylesterase